MKTLRWIFNCWVQGEFYFHPNEHTPHMPWKAARRRARTGEIQTVDRRLLWVDRKTVTDWMNVGSAHGIFAECGGKRHFQ